MRRKTGQNRERVPALGPSFIKAAREALNQGGEITHDPADLKVYSYDSSGLLGEALLVAFPTSTEEVARLVSLCANEGLKVYPRGAGSGRTGGAVPIVPGVVISLERMNRILEVSDKDLVLRAGPGAVTGRIQEVAQKKGLFYPPDPASLGFCTIGGNVATCAGGPRAVKYGVTRDYVLGLTVVTGDGSVLSFGGRTMKGVVGLDLVRLLTGSEGTLGVFTEVTLKLIPQPRAVGSLVAFFRSVEDAGEAILQVFKSGLLPRAAEIMDKTCARLCAESGIIDVEGPLGGALLLESDGLPDAVEEELSMMEASCIKVGSVSVRRAQGKAVEMLWDLRRSLGPAINRLGFSGKVSEDIVVPRGKIPLMLRRLGEIEKRLGVKIVTFGHAGDGNLHVNILFDRHQAKAMAHEAVKEVFQEAINCSGRLSGEHGIGLTKRDYLTLELGKNTIELMNNIKGAFDPKGILNPGKVYEA